MFMTISHAQTFTREALQKCDPVAVADTVAYVSVINISDEGASMK